MKIVLHAAVAALLFANAAGAAPLSSADLLKQSKASDWRAPDPEQTIYFDLDETGTRRVVMELAPDFAPINAGNIRALVKAHFYDGLPIYRVQDGYVVQFGMEQTPKDVPTPAAKAVKGEYVRKGIKDLPFAVMPYKDGYAPEAGFSSGMPAGRDPKADEAWLAHCYGAVGMSRDNDPDSGGTDMYVVIGNGIRHLDRNITVFARVIRGMEHLATLERGADAMGMLTDPKAFPRIVRARLEAEVPESERLGLRILRTDTRLWHEYVESRANRREDWFARPAGYVDLCNVPVPVRSKGD